MSVLLDKRRVAWLKFNDVSGTFYFRVHYTIILFVWGENNPSGCSKKYGKFRLSPAYTNYEAINVIKHVMRCVLIAVSSFHLPRRWVTDRLARWLPAVYLFTYESEHIARPHRLFVCPVTRSRTDLPPASLWWQAFDLGQHPHCSNSCNMPSSASWEVLLRKHMNQWSRGVFIIYMIFNVRFDSVAFLFVTDACPHVWRNTFNC